MRTWLLVLASAALGTALGYAAADRVVGRPGDTVAVYRQLRDSVTGAAATTAGPPAAKVEIDEPIHRFGVMEKGSTRTHTFKLRNAGSAPLKVKVGATSCKCTVGDVEDRPAAPGESIDVKLEWVAKVNPGEFRQTASLQSNDPRRPQFELVVEGRVIEAEGIDPPEFYFDRLRAGERSTQTVTISDFRSDGLQVEVTGVEPKEYEPYFEITTEPVPKDQYGDPLVKSAIRVHATALPTLPQGELFAWVGVRNVATTETRQVQIVGRVLGDLSIRGARWNETSGSVNLGVVSSSKGITENLLLSVKGEHAATATAKVASVEPAELQVQLGEPRTVRESVTHIPVALVIPPGTSPMLRLNPEQGGTGRVTLRTNHPITPDITFEVRFAVER